MRVQPRRLRAGAVLAAAALALTGCGDGEQAAETDPAGSDPTSSDPTGTSAPPAAQTAAGDDGEPPTPDPTLPGPAEHRFPEAGVTVVAPAPATETEAEALAAYVEFAREWRWSLGQVELSERLVELAATPIVDSVERSLTYQVEHDIHYSGTLVLRPTVEQSREDRVVLGGCIDASDVVLVVEGEGRLPDRVDEFPVVPLHAVLVDDGTGWTVQQNTVNEEEHCADAGG